MHGRGCQAGDPDVMSLADVDTKPGTNELHTCTDTIQFDNRTAFE